MLHAAVELLLPARCPGCGERAVALCAACRLRLRSAPAAPPPPGVAWWVAPFAYDGPLRELVARAKYRQARTGLPWLAAEVASAVRRLPAGTAVDVVTWPPTTAVRRRGRGFDQAALLARLVARELGRPARPLLARRGGPAQTGRSRAERAAGPGFSVRRAAAVAGRSVLVVDDVATTGATLAAAAGALAAAGAAPVAAATAARTVRRGGGECASLLKGHSGRADTCW